jgi:hypothetical protein
MSSEGTSPVIRGRLRHGNPSGDLAAVARCGALTRHRAPCHQPAMSNGRCRLHGGKSTGPRTREGRERIRSANTVHGRYSAEAVERRRRGRALIREMVRLCRLLDGD